MGRGQVQLCGNVFVENSFTDVMLAVVTKEGKAGPSSELAGKVASLWRFEGNWRDLEGENSSSTLPLSPNDHKTTFLRFRSTDPTQPGFMQPVEGSPLSTGGLGAKGPWLPEYAGAVPPKGVAPWDWSLTWRARHGGLPSKP